MAPKGHLTSRVNLRVMSREWIASDKKSEQDIQYLCSYESDHAWELMYSTQINKYMDEVISEGKDICYKIKHNHMMKNDRRIGWGGKGERVEVRLGSIIK